MRRRVAGIADCTATSVGQSRLLVRNGSDTLVGCPWPILCWMPVRLLRSRSLVPVGRYFRGASLMGIERRARTLMSWCSCRLETVGRPVVPRSGIEAGR